VNAPRRLLILICLACTLGPAAGAHASVPDGSGFGIADNDHIPSRSLDASFVLLRPQHFRFIVPWDVLDDPGIRAQVADRIGLARAAGAREIAISFGPPVAAVGAPVWLDRVARFVGAFSPSVAWWSPANEPNHPSAGWISTPEGAAKLAQYSLGLEALLAIKHPTDRQLSPDLHDDYARDNLVRRDEGGVSSVERYVRAFVDSGGTLGDAVAWHPYDGAMRQSLDSTVDLLDNALPPDAPFDVWVTEVGGILERHDSSGALAIALTPEQQNAVVSFITGPLAALPRISRISYYHVRDHNPVWDSALVDELGARRPAWYTWCAARHGGGADPDCASPTG
jgi:hypothetical protein